MDGITKSLVEFRLAHRPAVVGVGTSDVRKALFFGFTHDGLALVELEGGKIYGWIKEEVRLLDTTDEFKKHDWKTLGN
jgi:hypothetical protein